jgi:hypothetical protein
MRTVARRLKDNDFLEAWYAGQHLSAETQKSQAQEELARLQNELAAVETADQDVSGALQTAGDDR